MKFVGICLITENVPALAAFYSEVFQVPAEGDQVVVRLGIQGGAFDIFSKQVMGKMAPDSLPTMGYGGYSIDVEVEDVDAEYERMVAKGVPVIKLPVTYPWGRRSFWFKDPDGNIVNFFSVVQSPG
jgi:predicted enzyme related to lactoylglutathione lyase